MRGRIISDFFLKIVVEYYLEEAAEIWNLIWNFLSVSHGI